MTAERPSGLGGRLGIGLAVIVLGAAAVAAAVSYWGLPTQSPASEEPRLAEQAHAILKDRCYACHADGGDAEGGVAILNVARLIATKKIRPGAAGQSRLIELVESPEEEQRMPREDAPLDTAEIAILRQWIDAGAPAFTESKPIARQRFQLADLLKAIHEDLAKLDAEDRSFARYFTLENLYNDPRVSDAKLRHYRAAVSKLINSLSNQHQLTPPRVVAGSYEAVLAIDLRDYGWDAVLWNRLVQGKYPYGLEHTNYPEQAATQAVASVLYNDYLRESAALALYIRADWFLVAASKGPLYRELLRLPPTVDELMKLLRVEDRPLRAGLSESNVAVSKYRVLEWRASQFGSFLQSFDFSPTNPTRVVVQFPFGPAASGAADADHSFVPDGGEFIFHLPNGLLAFAICDAQGKLIDRAPTDIVADREGVAGTTSIEAGASCMHCHKRGYITGFVDIVHDDVALGGDRKAQVRKLYNGKKLLDRLDDENARYGRVLREVVGPFVPKSYSDDQLGDQGTPSHLVRRYLTVGLSLEDVAYELGLANTDDLKQAIKHGALPDVLKPLLVDGNTIPRSLWEAEFQKAALKMKLGTPQ